MPEGQFIIISTYRSLIPSLQILPIQFHQHREYRAAPSIGAISTRHHEQTHEGIARPTTTISSGAGGNGSVSCCILQ